MRCYFHYSCQTEYQIVRCKGNNSYEKDIKTYKFRIISGMWKRSIVYIYSACVWKTARKRLHYVQHFLATSILWIAPANMVSNWSSKTSSNKLVLIRNCMMSNDGASLQPYALHSTINV